MKVFFCRLLYSNLAAPVVTILQYYVWIIFATLLKIVITGNGKYDL